jgi:2,3-bisphosphoglycerate-independent phosphoglycerate mutase
VPLILTRAGTALRDGGELSDLAPTVLDLLSMPLPAAMTGVSLVSADR